MQFVYFLRTLVKICHMIKRLGKEKKMYIIFPWQNSLKLRKTKGKMFEVKTVFLSLVYTYLCFWEFQSAFFLNMPFFLGGGVDISYFYLGWMENNLVLKIAQSILTVTAQGGCILSIVSYKTWKKLIILPFNNNHVRKRVDCIIKVKVLVLIS